MSSVSKLKDKARDFERKEDWGKAVDAYLQVIQATEKGDSEAELSLYNRVGDLYLRLGRPSDAVDYYSKAADHYGEAGLYNNAIALCNKALRYQPDRLDLYRKLGKLSAEQGFITDARRWYLEYAERLAKQGKTQEAFDALKEFAGLSEDPEIREMLAAQLEHRGEVNEAVVQLRLAYTQYTVQSAGAKVAELRKRILTLDPKLEGADLSLTSDGAAGGQADDLTDMYIDRAGPPRPAAPAAPEAIAVEDDFGLGGEPAGPPAAEALPGLDLPDADADEVEAAELPGLMATDMGGGVEEEVLAADLPTLEIEQGASLVDEEEEAAADLELPSLRGEDEYGEGGTVEAEPLAGLEGFGESDDDLPMLSGELAKLDEEEEAQEDLEPLPTFEVEEEAEPAPEDEVEEAVALTEEEPAEEPAAAEVEDEQTRGEIGAALDQVMVDAPAAAEDLEHFESEPLEEPEAEEAVEDEPPAEVSAGPVVGEILDVDALIRGARERFEAGERREALATLDAQHANLADANRLVDAYWVAEALVGMDPDAVSAHQSRVEYAFRLDDRPRLVDAYLDFAGCLRRTGAEAKSASVFQRVLEIDPQNAAARAALAKPTAPAAAPAAAAAESQFVDLGGLMMDEEEKQTTRFVVAETVESGDEERDFAEMLSQFRAKVAQHVPQEDTESHYDLGIAFKEMGLIDEAISEFQIALRGGNERLKVYEELGQCFMQKEQYNIAAKLLARGAQLPANDDSELLGVYYLLGRCYEELGQTAEAKEAFERVLGLDIDFRDVNERLSRL